MAEFLKAKLGLYLEAKAAKKTKAFFATVVAEWFDQFPEAARVVKVSTPLTDVDKAELEKERIRLRMAIVKRRSVRSHSFLLHIQTTDLVISAT